MNIIKSYKVANKKKGQVVFGSQHGGRWHFKIGKFEKIMKVPGGQKVAEKIAEAIHKAWLRTNGKGLEDFQRVDGICQAAINRLIKLRTLVNWVPDIDWW